MPSRPATTPSSRGTFSVNVAACAGLGFLTGATTAASVPQALQHLTGSFESLRLAETGAKYSAAANAVVSVAEDGCSQAGGLLPQCWPLADGRRIPLPPRGRPHRGPLAGSIPGDLADPVAVETMAAVGIDISATTPKILTTEAVQAPVTPPPWAAVTPARPRQEIPRLGPARPGR